VFGKERAELFLRMTSGVTDRAAKSRASQRIAAVATVCLLSLPGADWANVAAAQQNAVDGKVSRDGIDLFYKIVGPAGGDYVLILSGGPGEDISSMQGIADELGKKYRCIM
jgi:hypothetical protein